MKVFARLTLAGALLVAACSDRIPSTASTSAIVSAGGLRLARTASSDEIVAGQVVVRYRETESATANRDAIPGKHRGRKKSELLVPRTELIEVAEGDELAVIESLRADPDVEWAEPDFVARVGPCEVSAACNIPDGAFFDYKWDLRNTGSWTNTIANFGPVGATVITGRADADIDWVEAFDYLGPAYSGAAVVGILDTGIRPTHTLFAGGKILGGRRFLPDTLTIAGGTTNFIDDHGHGSHTAGLAAGRAASPTPAVAGVAYGANIKILVGKVCNSGGTCPSTGTANAIVWAADNGANVINMSLGSFGSNPDGTGSALQQAAMQYALSKNVLSVCATGNDDGKPTYAGNIGYPARFPECFAVAATDWGDNKASYSNYGPETDISAPGGDGELQPFSLIPSASRNGDNSYAWNAGTSMATPEVAGLAALLYSRGLTTPAQVRQRITETADDIDAPGWDARTGWGRINVYRAITGVSPNAPPVANPGAGYAGNKGVAVQFTGAASNDPNGKAITFAWNFGDPTSASNTSTETNPAHTYMRAGNYTVTLTVTDAANLSATSSRVAAIPNIVPAISFAGATILQGETFATSGSFADADPDSWTASVGYGDGSESLGLALTAAKGFSLSHRYMAAGAHTVAVNVSDDDGGNGSSSAIVTVWTPQQAIQELLLNEIDAHLALISAQQAAADANGIMNSLGAKGRAAIAALDRGQGNTAENQLGAFINHLEALAKSGKVAPGVASAWIATANRIIVSINR